MFQQSQRDFQVVKILQQLETTALHPTPRHRLFLRARINLLNIDTSITISRRVPFKSWTYNKLSH